jgi:hypothetical protein
MVHRGNKKRGLAAERRDLADQKKEADRFAAARAKLERARTQYALWKLYHVEKDIMDASRTLDVSARVWLPACAYAIIVVVLLRLRALCVAPSRCRLTRLPP